jgi:DNA-binding transcriptional LysR family regulator
MGDRMDVNLELYRIFREVARQQSFSGAAKALYISQPAVSQAVKQLEHQLGARLFMRGPRGVTLTGEGEILAVMPMRANLLESGRRLLRSRA